MRKTWTDERLDDLSGRVEELGRRMNNGFASLRSEMRSLREEMRSDTASLREEMGSEISSVRQEMTGRIDGLDHRLDSLQRVILQGTIALSGTILAGFGGIIALIAAQG